MELVVGWLMFSVVVAIIAVHRGRNGLGWLLLAVCISPLLAGILVLALGRPDADALDDRARPETHVRCPDCRELVRRDARKCKHCGSGLVPQ